MRREGAVMRGVVTIAWWGKQPARTVPMGRDWSTKDSHFSLLLLTSPVRTSHWLMPRATRRHGSLLVQSLQVSLSWVEYVCREYRWHSHATYPFFLLFHTWDREAVPAAHCPLAIFSLPWHQLLSFNQLGPITGCFCSNFFHLTTTTQQRNLPSLLCVFLAFLKKWQLRLGGLSWC